MIAERRGGELLTITFPAVLSLPHAMASEGASHPNPSDDQGPKRVRPIVRSEYSTSFWPRPRIPALVKGDWLDWDYRCWLGTIDADWACFDLRGWNELPQVRKERAEDHPRQHG